MVEIENGVMPCNHCSGSTLELGLRGRMFSKKSRSMKTKKKGILLEKVITKISNKQVAIFWQKQLDEIRGT